MSNIYKEMKKRFLNEKLFHLMNGLIIGYHNENRHVKEEVSDLNDDEETEDECI